MNTPKTIPQDTKKLFLKLGTCSQLFFHLLNREFGDQKQAEERAADPLAGGLMLTGQQCGMLWGAALGVGEEAFRRYDDLGQATSIAITATQHLMASFSKRARTVNCREITNCNFTTPWGIAKGFLFGKFKNCFNFAEKWAPEAIQAAREGLSHQLTNLPQHPISCASEVAKKTGASDEEIIMVAGFAGGLGLSGNACGALSAAIWLTTLAWNKEQPDKPTYPNPNAKRTLQAFNTETGSEMLCHKIAGKRFESIDEHTEFIKSGGCDKLIDVLARS